jgi:hypothetical protein
LATFVAVALPLAPFEPPEPKEFGALANASRRLASPVDVAAGACRGETRDGFSVPRDHDLLAALDSVKQLSELVLGFESANFIHG